MDSFRIPDENTSQAPEMPFWLFALDLDQARADAGADRLRTHGQGLSCRPGLRFRGESTRYPSDGPKDISTKYVGRRNHPAFTSPGTAGLPGLLVVRSRSSVHS